MRVNFNSKNGREQEQYAVSLSADVHEWMEERMIGLWNAVWG